MDKKDICTSIGLHLNYYDLFSWSLTCKRTFKWLWDNDKFWKLKLNRDFPSFSNVKTKDVTCLTFKKHYENFNTELFIYDKDLKEPEIYNHVKFVACGGCSIVYITADSKLYQIYESRCKKLDHVPKEILSNAKDLKCSFYEFCILTHDNSLHLYLLCNNYELLTVNNVKTFSMYGNYIAIIYLDDKINVLTLKKNIYEISHEKTLSGAENIFIDISNILIQTKTKNKNTWYHMNVENPKLKSMGDKILLANSKYGNICLLTKEHVIYHEFKHKHLMKNPKNIISNNDLLAILDHDNTLYISEMQNILTLDSSDILYEKTVNNVIDATIGYKKLAVLSFSPK